MFDFWSNFWPGWVRAEVFVFCSLRRNTFKINCLWVRSEILMCLISGPDQIGLWGFFLGPLIGALTAASQRSAKKCPVINVLWFFSFFFFDANVVVLSHRGRSEVEREMAPESYGLLMPGLSDSWLAGLWAREASIWASDTWNNKEKNRKWNPRRRVVLTTCWKWHHWGRCVWDHFTSSNFLALYCSAPFRKFSRMMSQRTVPWRNV